MPDIQHVDLTSIHRFAFVGTVDPGAVGANKGWVDSNTTPHQLKIRNAANTAWIAVGSAAPVDGSGAVNRLAAWADVDTLTTGFFFDGVDAGIGITAALGANLHVKASSNARVAGLFTTALSSAATADGLQVGMYDGVLGFSVGADGSVTMGRTYDAVNLKHAAQHIFRYSSGGSLSGTGLLINEHNSGANIRIHALSGNSLYITDNVGAAAPMTLGSRINPGDGSTFNAAFGLWTISAGDLALTDGRIKVRRTTEQARFEYDAANYGTLTVGAAGNVTLLAVGGAGVKFIFSNDIEIADAKNLILNATTGTKIGSATTQKLGFWNATPIAQPTTAVAAAVFAANTSAIVNDSATFDGYTIGQIVKALRNEGLLA